jgi:hypothetical protein
VKGQRGFGEVFGIYGFCTGLFLAAQDQAVWEESHAHAKGAQAVGKHREPVIAFHTKFT